MSLRILALPFAMAAAHAHAAASPACVVQISNQGTTIQEGQVVTAQVAAVSDEPITRVEINGVKDMVDATQLLLWTKDVAMSVPGKTQINARVQTDSGAWGDCESAAIDVKAKPVCGPNEQEITQMAIRSMTKSQLTVAELSYMERETICR